MQIHTKTKLLDIKRQPFKVKNGTEVTELTLGDVLIDALAMFTAGGKMKMYTLAKSIVENEVVAIDDADLILVKKACEAFTGYNNIVMGQVLLTLEK